MSESGGEPRSEEYEDCLILVTRVPKEYEEALEAFVSNKRKGGGVVQNFQYDDEHEVAWITFKDSTVATHFLKAEAISIEGHEMKVLTPPNSKTLYVRSVSNAENELLELFLESPKKGGGLISSYDFDASSEIVSVSFEDREVAERLLRQNYIEVKGKKLSFSKIPPDAKSTKCTDDIMDDIVKAVTIEEDDDIATDSAADNAEEQNCSICIQNVHPDMVAFLEIVLSQVKTGGGNIKQIVQDGDDVLVTFEDASVAQGLLNAGNIHFGKTVLTVVPQKKFSSSRIEERVTDDDDDDDDHNDDEVEEELPSARVLATGIPKCMPKEILFALLERDQDGGGVVIDLQYEIGDEHAVVHFEDHQVAKNLLKAGYLQFKQTVLRISPVTEADKDDSKNIHENSTVELSWNIPKELARDMLLLFLENKRRSGGGEVEDLALDDKIGRAKVQFKDYGVAKSLLEKGKIQYTDGTWLTVSKPTASAPASEAKEIPGQVEIVGIPVGTKKQTLMMFLENKKRSGGGEVIEEQFNYDENSNTATVTFRDPSIAKEMLQKGELKFGKNILSVHEPGSSSHTATSIRAENGSNRGSQPKSRTVEIRGFLNDLSKENVHLWFENKNRSGGGPVELFQILSNDSAILVFQRAEDAESVADRQVHTISKVEVTATLLDSWPDVGGPHAIKVQGFKKETIPEMVEMYFENTNRSGGESYKDFLWDDSHCSAVIVYGNPEAVQRIIKKTHVLDGSNLSVEPLLPARPPPLLKLDQVDPNKVLFTEFETIQIDHKKLQEFAEKAAKVPVRNITYSSRPGAALIQFVKAPDFENVKAVVCIQPFQGKMISVQRIPFTKSVQIQNIGRLSQEMLELYFENQKIGGGNLKTLHFVEGSYAVIEFFEDKVLQTVLGRKHTFNQQDLSVQIFYPCLGIFPPGFNGSSPMLSLPPDFKIECGKAVLHFLLIPHQKKHIEQHLRKLKCFVIWPRAANHYLTLHCTVDPGEPSGFKQIQNWKESCENFLRKEIESVRCGEIIVLDEIWRMFKERIMEKNMLNSQGLLTEFDEQRHIMVYSGSSKYVDEFEKIANAIKNELEEELDRSKKEIRDHAGLKPHQIYLLKSSGILSKQQNVRFEEMGKKLEIIGHPPAVRTAKLELLQFVNRLLEKMADFRSVSDAFEKSLSKAAMNDHIHSCFSKSGIIASYEVRKKDVMLFSVDQHQLDLANRLITSEIIEETIKLDGPMSELLGKKDWINYKASLVKDFPLLELSELNSAVVFLSKKDDKSALFQKINDFFSGNAFYEEFIQLPDGVMEVLFQYGSSDLDQLKQIVKPVEVKVLPFVSGRCGFSIRAKKCGLKGAISKVKELEAKVLCRDYIIQNEGTIKFLKDKRRQQCLQGIGSTKNVVIKFEDEDRKGKTKMYSDPTVYSTAQSKKHQPSKIAKLVLGDITKNRTDVVVNAANSKLEHNGGVALAIARAGDSKLVEECKQRIRAEGNLSPGKVFTSTAGGSLPHKAVIHTVGPIWKNGTNAEEKELQDAIKAALEEADRRLHKTVSLPFLSAGIFGYPKRNAALIIVRAVKNFLATSRCVNEVHIVNGKQETIDILHDAFGEAYLPGEVNLIPSLIGAGSVKTKRSAKNRVPPSQLGQISTTATLMATGNDTFQTSEGIKISLVKGSIANQKVDVVFVSVEKDLNLAKTAISKSVLLASGNGMQAECRESWPQGIEFGNVIRTGPHRLPCKAVYHGACQRWDNGAGNSELVIRKLMRSALQMASNDGLRSIAFPALGTGIKLKTPCNIVAQLMIDEAVQFSATTANTTLKEIKFVIYEKDLQTLDAFEKELGHGGGGSATGGHDISEDVEDGYEVNSHQSEDSDDEDEDEEDDDNDKNNEIEDFGVRNDSDSSDNEVGQFAEQSSQAQDGRKGSYSRKHYRNKGHGTKTSSSSSSGSGMIVGDCQIGDVKFQVKCEDILKSSADAIVNGTNEKLSLRIGKLSRAILHAAGEGIQEECFRYGLVNGMAISSGGRMSCKHIFHITAKDTKDWKTVIGNVLKEADKMKLTSISIPPVGVGRGSITVKDFAEAIFDEVYDFSSKQPQYLRNIVVSILDQRMLHDFVSVIEKGENFQRSRVTKFFSSMSDKVKAFYKDIRESVTGSNDSKNDNGRHKKYSKRKTKPAGNQKQPIKLVLKIYGLDQHKIDDAITDIKDLCKDAEVEHILNSEHVKAAIAKLTPKQEQQIKNLEKEFSVKILIDKRSENREIRLISNGKDVTPIVTTIHEIVFGMITQEKNSKELELLAKQATWQYTENGTVKKYGVYATGTIERSFQQKKIELEYTGNNKIKHKINFKDMIDERTPGRKVSISRTVLGSVNLPHRWKPMKSDDIYTTVPLNTADEEYKKVEANLRKTDQGTVRSIIKIERIQNPGLYRQYTNRKLDLDRTNPGQENEKRLWHGTNGANVININSRNFNRSYSGQHGVAIGNGVYFATNANYSVSGYCPADGFGQKHIYQARVLTGKYCRGQGGLKEAPMLPNRTDATYDSVVDNVTNPGMFVVFLDYQTYPEYHITFA